MCAGGESLQWGHLFDAAYSYSGAPRTTCACHVNWDQLSATGNETVFFFFFNLLHLIHKKKEIKKNRQIQVNVN